MVWKPLPSSAECLFTYDRGFERPIENVILRNCYLFQLKLYGKCITSHVSIEVWRQRLIFNNVSTVRLDFIVVRQFLSRSSVLLLNRLPVIPWHLKRVVSIDYQTSLKRDLQFGRIRHNNMVLLASWTTVLVYGGYGGYGGINLTAQPGGS